MLGKMKAVESVPHLKYLAKVDFPEIQAAAYKALGQLGVGVCVWGGGVGVCVCVLCEREREREKERERGCMYTCMCVFVCAHQLL